ncbi:MAG TPA: hypothetical protein DCS93_34275 [Microscillaceae bacterium]|nr:hypothetical protein [Microscillaceae bacterium]
MGSLQIFQALMIFGVVQGGILVLAINRLPQKHMLANRVLSIFVLLISVTLLWRITRPGGLLKQIIGIIQDEIIFLYGPVFYLYAQVLLTNIHFSFKQWRIHLLPAVLYLVFQPLMYYNKAFWSPFFAFIILAAFGHSTIYLFKSYRLVVNFKRKSADKRTYINYLQFIIGLLLLCLILGTLTVIAYYLNLPYEFKYYNYDVVWISVSFITFALGYFAMFSPEIFRLPPKEILPANILAKKRTTPRKIIPAEQMDRWKIQLEQWMKNERPYLDPKLTLPELATQLQMDKNQVSQIIHEGFHLNFYDFINVYRVEHFITLSQDKNYQHYTLLGLAFEVGFNSKSTFHKAFKKVKNTTPKVFLNSQKNNSIINH